MRHIQTSSRAIVHRGPGRVQVALAAAWMILSLAIGTAISAQPGGDSTASQGTSSAIGR